MLFILVLYLYFICFLHLLYAILFLHAYYDMFGKTILVFYLCTYYIHKLPYVSLKIVNKRCKNYYFFIKIYVRSLRMKIFFLMDVELIVLIIIMRSDINAIN